MCSVVGPRWASQLYCRRELQLLLGASDNEESQSLTSERGVGDPLSDGASDQGDDLVDEEMAGRELYQDSSDETRRYQDGIY